MGLAEVARFEKARSVVSALRAAKLTFGWPFKTEIPCFVASRRSMRGRGGSMRAFLMKALPTMQIQINARPQALSPDDDQPLLWLLREQLGLSGTKFGCGIGVCGACTVQMDGQPVRSCTLPARDLAGRQVRTIEALDQHPRGRALQQAWLALQVPQCGYCQSGMLMAADALLAGTPNPSDAQIAAAMTNLCRCGTYPRVKAAIQAAAAALTQGVAA